MIDYGKTRSTVKPEPLRIDEFSVWVHSNIEPITESDGDDGEGFNGFEFDMVQYDKDEYIEIMAIQNKENNEILNTILGVNSNG
jgi:hypothetical protein